MVYVDISLRSVSRPTANNADMVYVLVDRERTTTGLLHDETTGLVTCTSHKP